MHRTLSYTSLPPLFPVKPFSSDYPPHIPPHPQQSAYPSPPMSYSPPPGGNPSHHQHDYRSGHQRSNSMRSDESRHPQSQQYVNGEHYHQYHQKYASTYQTPAPSSGDLRSRAVTHQSEYPFHTSLSSSSATTAAGAGATAAQTPARRTKSHVASACVNCRKAHLACDVQRPCPRCISLHKEDTCKDVQHKKRGRPRLRDDNRMHSFEAAPSSGFHNPSPIPSPNVTPQSTYRPPKYTALQSHSSHDTLGNKRQSSLTPNSEGFGYNGYFPPQPEPDRRGGRINLPPLSNATAHLTTNLEVVKSTESLRELLGYPPHNTDAFCSLFDVVLENDHQKVHTLRERIRRDAHQRGFRDDIPRDWLFREIQKVREIDIPRTSSETIHETLHLRRPDGIHLKIRIRATLNSYSQSLFFVLVEFSLASEMPPPLQFQNGQSPPYQSGSHSHTHSSSSGTPSLNSPAFLTSSGSNHQRSLQPEPLGSASPYTQYGQHLSRPRTAAVSDSHYPEPPSQTQHHQYSYSSPSHPPVSYAHTALYDQPRGYATAGHQPNDLQLPPLQLGPQVGYGNSHHLRQENGSRYDHPRRERIEVREMLD